MKFVNSYATTAPLTILTPPPSFLSWTGSAPYKASNGGPVPPSLGTYDLLAYDLWSMVFIQVFTQVLPIQRKLGSLPIVDKPNRKAFIQLSNCFFKNKKESINRIVLSMSLTNGYVLRISISKKHFANLWTANMKSKAKHPSFKDKDRNFFDSKWLLLTAKNRSNFNGDL